MTEPTDDDALLAELDAAFERGDYYAVRMVGKELEARTSDAETLSRARAIVARTEPDPAMRWLFAIALLLIVLVSGYWITHPPH